MGMLDPFWRFYHRCASPRYFYGIAGKLIPWFGIPALLLMIAGVYGGLVTAPTHYEQGESYRIIFIHVPAASLSLMIYIAMAVAAAVSIVWRIKMADIIMTSAAPIGASMTLLALVTGSLWGKPTWGTWWQWDARMTAELILLFLYLGFIALNNAIDNRRSAANACAILVLAGVVIIPIIKYSVDPALGFNTLHQGSTRMFDDKQLAPGMREPLLMMIGAFMLFFFTTLLMRARTEVLQRERRAGWVRELLEKQHG